ncbi:MAG: CARDB domain-containing protein, partial [Desulfobulbaceae bacterium]|nr:CARDB domain-containing protein [Desulfobulbaceae bacterium]
ITPNLHSGDAVTISWNVANTGNAPTASSFYDYVRVRNTTTGEWLYSNTLHHNAASQGSIAAGGNLARSVSFTLPNGTRGVGDLEVTVSTDWYNQVFEHNTSGTAESNNTATTTVASTIGAYADLQVQNLGVTPSNFKSGDSVTVNWEVFNSGNASTSGSFYDLVTVVNQDTNETLVNTWVHYDQNSGGVINSGDFRTRSYNFNLPQGTRGAGNLLITVNADVGNYIFEFNSGGTGETNNSASANVTSQMAPYPDLAVTDIQAPVSALAGRPSQISWTVSNLGNLTATGSWSEQVWLSTDDAIGGDQLLATFWYTGNNLAASGGNVTRTESVTLSSFATGSYRLVVRTDTGNALFETNEANNVAIDDAAFDMGAALNLTLNTSQVAEQAGANAATGTIVRSGSTSSALTVNLSSSHSDLVLPSSVVIPVGQSSVSFTVGVTDNTLVDGNRNGSVTATATGFADGAAS